MPFGADLRDFPMNITLDSACMLIVGFFTGSPGAMVNLQWLLGLTAAAATMSYSLLRLGASPWIAAALGPVYALQPYGFYRGVSHLHSMYYLVPLVATGAVELALGHFPGPDPSASWPRRVFALIPPYLWIGSIAIGMSYLYATFFSCFLLTLGACLAYLARRELRDLLLGAILVGLICTVALIDLSPSLVHWATAGRNPAMDFKHPAEAEIYGLKLRFLVTPIPNHPIPLFSSVANALRDANFPHDTENESARLGTLGSLGLCALFVTLAAGPFRPRLYTSHSGQLLAVCAVLTLGCILLTTVGGFADFFNTFVSSEIRAYNRISPFISFFCIVAVAVLIKRVENIFTPPRARLLFRALLILLTCLATFDQAVTGGYLPHSGREDLWRQDNKFVKEVEFLLPADSSIFQLPHADFPVEALHEKMFNNDHGRPYVHALKTRWSWGAITGTISAEWNRQAAALPVEDMVHRLAHRGFSGIWTDLYGYKAPESPEPALTAALQVSPLRSASGRYLFYDMRPYKARLADRESILDHAAMLHLHPVEITLERGLYSRQPMSLAGISSTEPGARLVLINPLNASRPITVSAAFEGAAVQPETIRVSRAGSSQVLSFDQPYSDRLVLPPLSRVAIDFDIGQRISSRRARTVLYQLRRLHIDDELSP